MNVEMHKYRDWLVAQGLAQETVKQRLKFARGRIAAWGTLDVPPHQVGEFLGAHTGWTRRTYFNHLQSLYRWQVESGQLTESPMRQFRRPPEPRPRPRPLSADELARVVAASSGDLRAWLLLGCLAGLRVHEIAKVHGDDVDETAIVVLGKGGEQAILPTHPQLWDLAQGYPRHDWWFPSRQRGHDHVSESLISTRVRNHFRALGIDQGSIHRLRHSYGTMLARNGAQTRVVQELMRHRSLETTQRYVDVDAEERRSAIAGLRLSPVLVA